MERVEQIENILILNDEPEFSASDDTKVSAEFFILCEENAEVELSKNVFDCKLCGMSILNWVVRACIEQPKIIHVESGADALSAIRPYISDDAEYSVVLYASTPLLNRTHIQDLLGFVHRRGMNACKLKKGFVFKNEYIKETSEIFSIDTYDFSSDDFFEVKTYEDMSAAREVLRGKVLAYHKKNGVFFEKEKSITIDANIEIGFATEVFGNVTIGNGTKIGSHCMIGKDVTLFSSQIGDNVKLGVQTIIINSIIKEGALVENGATVINSVVGENCRVGWSSKLIETSLRDNTIVERMVVIDNARIGENCIIGKHAELLGLKEKLIIEKDTQISPKSVVIDKLMKRNTTIPIKTAPKDEVL